MDDMVTVLSAYGLDKYIFVGECDSATFVVLVHARSRDLWPENA